MEKTFAELVLEVETLVKPLGFSILETGVRDKTPLIGGVIKDTPADEIELKISIVRKGAIG